MITNTSKSKEHPITITDVIKNYVVEDDKMIYEECDGCPYIDKCQMKFKDFCSQYKMGKIKKTQLAELEQLN